MNKILLCCDLDRTVLPNGPQPESAGARPVFDLVTARAEISLVYVSGRDLALIEEAITTYRIPLPDYAIADVGTTIYSRLGAQWQTMHAWQEELARHWCDITTLSRRLQAVAGLQLQEAEKQGRFKLSYYTPVDINRIETEKKIRHLLHKEAVAANLIWSIDEVNQEGLLDILPEDASKLHGIEFLARQIQIPFDAIVFAGDSGNDIPVLASPIKAVLVNNALDTVKQEAIELATRNGTLAMLYLASGDFLSLNGNYSAGILEGLAHYYPETKSWIEQALASLTPSRE